MDAEINKIIIETLLPFKPKQICVFGSYARGEMNEDSDIDVLYDFKKSISLFDLVEMKQELEEKLMRKIDLVSKRGLKDWMKPYVMQDLNTIYEKN
ncbi:nucleotidyltransferase domain-containing protein [Aequorivita todarodis]|uniref:nucleotidyltransferase family protein n=1 Tax=Aequorivita todarodis TaxID=2036821 RepID=UPI0023504516|nr:nucleotidyltransferase domain-containing protein [Aequorivita todarodis]MDC8002205.1 nucleotidyltransferase domain-containing protein [Aequorivita todarodis]